MQLLNNEDDVDSLTQRRFIFMAFMAMFKFKRNYLSEDIWFEVIL